MLGALIFILLILLFFIGATLYWAHVDRDSRLAATIRELTGIPLAGGEALADDADPVVEPEQPPEPAAEVEEPIEPEPEPEKLVLDWPGFLERDFLWPDTLRITLEKSVPIQYYGTNFGEMFFTPGQLVQVDSIREDFTIRGTVNGNDLIIATDQTNFRDWLEETYGEEYILNIPKYGQDAGQKTERAELLSILPSVENELRRWALVNYQSGDLSIGPKEIVIAWALTVGSTSDYRYEARRIARKYLELQAEANGTDNFASCRIVHPETGELLGVDSIFIPALYR